MSKILSSFLSLLLEDRGSPLRGRKGKRNKKGGYSKVEGKPKREWPDYSSFHLLGLALLYLFTLDLILASAYAPTISLYLQKNSWAALGASLLVTLLLLSEQALLVLAVATQEISVRHSLAGFFSSFLLWLFLSFLSLGTQPPEASAFLLPWENLFLMVAAMLLGYSFSFMIKEAGLLLPVALVAGMVDYWGVYYGTTHQVLKKAPHIVSKLSTQMPSLGGVGPVLTIGFGDFFFLTLFLSCLHRFNLHTAKTFNAFLLWLALALFLVLFLEIPIPALVPMAIAVLTVNPELRRLTPQEVVATVVVIILVGFFLLGLTLLRPF